MQDQPRPTFADIKAMREQRKKVLSAMHARMELADEWLHADDDPSPVTKYIAKGFAPDHTYNIFPYAWTVLNRGINQIATAEVPQVTYELPAEDKKTYSKWADDEKAVQIALQGIIYKLVTGSTENPINDLLQQQLGPGMGALSYTLDYDVLGMEPEEERGTPAQEERYAQYQRRRAEALPWRVDSLHPTWLLFDTDHNPPHDYIIHRPVSRNDMADRYPQLGLSRSEGTTDATVMYTEYCSERFYGCWVDDKKVTPDSDEEGIAENTTRHPFVQMAWSGMGKKDKDGSWERRGVGMIQRGISTFRALTRDDNRLEVIKDVMMPKYMAQGDDKAKTEDEVAEFDPQSPAMGVLSRDITLKPLDAPTVPPALLDNLERNGARLEQLYGPGILSGQDVQAGEPASKWAARTEAARGPYRTPKKNAEQAVANMLADMLWDIQYEPDLKDGVTVTWEQGKGKQKQRYSAHIKPSQIHPGGKITVDFSPMTLDERQAKREDALAKQDAGWYSTETAMKEGGEVDDTEEELAKIQADRVMQSPEFIGFQTQLALAALQARPDVQAMMPPPPAPPMGDPMAAGGGAPVPPMAPAAPAMPMSPFTPPQTVGAGY